MGSPFLRRLRRRRTKYAPSAATASAAAAASAMMRIAHQGSPPPPPPAATVGLPLVAPIAAKTSVVTFNFVEFQEMHGHRMDWL